MHDWPTKIKDLLTAKFYIEQYASNQGVKDAIGIFEVNTNLDKKCFEIQLSPWVEAIIGHFEHQYGVEEGQQIARKVISLCFTQGHTVH